MANIVISPTGNPLKSNNRLLCDSGPYALCFFSGPPHQTKTNPGNNPLPCVKNESGESASCSGQSYSDQSLVPGFDTISTFSMAMQDDHTMLPTLGKGEFLGCMTAPCDFPEGTTDPQTGLIVQCQCPLARGTFRLGQKLSSENCSIAAGSNGTQYLWSAARTVVHGDPIANRGS